MVAAANLVEVAALVGDTTRATILAALMSGHALTGTELAHLARVSKSTASEHLARLTDARLISVIRQGRFNYYRIASPLVAQMLEGMIAVAAIELPARYRPRSAQEDALRIARTCYNHLAGRLGVAIADALVARGHVELGEEGGEVTPSGMRFFADFGADLTHTHGRVFCKPCLDWSERRYHLAGTVGTAIWARCLERRWLVRDRDSRAVRVTREGTHGLREAFDIEPEHLSLATQAAA
jgi:DNA-binding transcriptional ArsR family regulator